MIDSEVIVKLLILKKGGVSTKRVFYNPVWFLSLRKKRGVSKSLAKSSEILGGGGVVQCTYQSVSISTAGLLDQQLTVVQHSWRQWDKSVVGEDSGNPFGGFHRFFSPSCMPFCSTFHEANSRPLFLGLYAFTEIPWRTRI